MFLMTGKFPIHVLDKCLRNISVSWAMINGFPLVFQVRSGGAAFN